MVTRVVDTASEGDLYNFFDSFGVYEDTLFLVMQFPLLNTYIWTGAGKDFVTVDVNSSNGNGYHFYLGSGDDRLKGSGFADKYYDQSGHDEVNMGAGADWIWAGKGNDTMDGGAGRDLISFERIYGTSLHPLYAPNDFTIADQGVSLNLNLTGAQNLGIFGTDTVLNFEDIIGTEGNDIFHGNSSANMLFGGNGSDYLRGREGDDDVWGGDGADTLIGDAGADRILTAFVGGSGGDGDADIVKYTHISNSTYDAFDTIFDFETFANGGGDKIDLSSIDANLSIVGDQSFAFRGTGSFISSGGEVRLWELGDSTYVQVDHDADAEAEMIILVMSRTGLTADDFIL